ncbi:MAG: hypothetical protein IT384_27520 [Deltaproteobacteria bacterium]|nr:hypothetical protein [Deltaproteobacteria bacterium]
MRRWLLLRLEPSPVLRLLPSLPLWLLPSLPLRLLPSLPLWLLPSLPLWLTLSISGCVQDATLRVPEPAPAAAIVAFTHPSVTLRALDGAELAGGIALAQSDGELRLLAYDRPLEALRLSPGILRPSAEGDPLPRPDRAYVASMAGSDAWIEDAVPVWLSSLKFTRLAEPDPCPVVTVDDTLAIPGPSGTIEGLLALPDGGALISFWDEDVHTGYLWRLSADRELRLLLSTENEMMRGMASLRGRAFAASTSGTIYEIDLEAEALRPALVGALGSASTELVASEGGLVAVSSCGCVVRSSSTGDRWRAIPNPEALGPCPSGQELCAGGPPSFVMTSSSALLIAKWPGIDAQLIHLDLDRGTFEIECAADGSTLIAFDLIARLEDQTLAAIGHNVVERHVYRPSAPGRCRWRSEVAIPELATYNAHVMIPLRGGDFFFTGGNGRTGHYWKGTMCVPVDRARIRQESLTRGVRLAGGQLLFGGRLSNTLWRFTVP